MTTMTQTATNTAGQNTAGFGALLGQAMLGGAIAAVLNVALFFGAKAAGVAMTGEFQPGTVSELPVVAVALSSLVPGLFAALAGLLFQKFTKNGARNFAILAVGFALFSLGGPANVKQIGTSTIAVMELMHVIAAVGLGGSVFRALKK